MLVKTQAHAFQAAAREEVDIARRIQGRGPSSVPDKAKTQAAVKAELTKTSKGIHDVKLLAPALVALKHQKT